MAITKALTLTTTPQDVVVQSVCNTVTLKEDESVASWPTSALIIKKPSTGDANTLTATAVSAQAFTTGTYLMVLGRKTD